jgi:CRP-like cAMP-binding protein
MAAVPEMEPFGSGIPAMPRGPSRLTLPAGASIGPAEHHSSHAYLIETGLVAVSINLEQTAPTSVEILGRGTLIGCGPENALRSVSYRTVMPTEAIKIASWSLRQAMFWRPELKNRYLAQLQERLSVVELVAACNAQHSLTERCARWLLRLQEYVGPVVPVTQTFLAMLLGVRRAGISVALQMLQQKGAVVQQRGRIVVLDTGCLTQYACHCPNRMIAPDNVIPADLVTCDTITYDRPRASIEREVRVHASHAMRGDDGWARREAALRVCQAVIAQAQSRLEL